LFMDKMEEGGWNDGRMEGSAHAGQRIYTDFGLDRSSKVGSASDERESETGRLAHRSVSLALRRQRAPRRTTGASPLSRKRNRQGLRPLFRPPPAKDRDMAGKYGQHQTGSLPRLWDGLSPSAMRTSPRPAAFNAYGNLLESWLTAEDKERLDKLVARRAR